MSIAKMSLVNIVGMVDELDAVLPKCAGCGIFHPEDVGHGNSKLTASKDYSKNPYAEPLQLATDICLSLAISPHYMDDSTLTVAPEDFDSYLHGIEQTIRSHKAQKLALGESISMYEQAQIQIQHLIDMEISFDDIFACQYTKVRFGRLPADSYLKLAYYEDKDYMFLPFDHDKEYYWGIYFTPQSNEEEIDSIFSSLYFERIRVPDYAHGTPEQALCKIKVELEQERQSYNQVVDALSQLTSDNHDTLLMIYSYLTFHNSSYDVRKYAVLQGNSFVLSGFIPSYEEKSFAELFQDLKSVTVEYLPIDADPRLIPPVKLKNKRLFEPFETFVTMYGLPGYHDIDPTPVIAVFYTILFGIMFGDVGQGLLISVIGWLMWKLKKIALGRILVHCGFSSAIFGLLYGSVFGFEHLLDPLYHTIGLHEKPLEVLSPSSTNTVIFGAIAAGACIILISIVFNILLGIKQRNIERAVFSHNGAAGLLLYGSIILAASLLLLFKINLLHPVFIFLCIIIPILIIFFKEPLYHLVQKRKAFPDKFGGFLIESFFEMFEVILSYITNTMSFLRVGGFILSHAGMMAVVFTLSEMVGTMGSPIVIILGNLFVMGLEGLIVGIQVLRLQFYEVFSRFFDGEGKPFAPINITYTVE